MTIIAVPPEAGHELGTAFATKSPGFGVTDGGSVIMICSSVVEVTGVVSTDKVLVVLSTKLLDEVSDLIEELVDSSISATSELEVVGAVASTALPCDVDSERETADVVCVVCASETDVELEGSAVKLVVVCSMDFEVVVATCEEV